MLTGSASHPPVPGVVLLMPGEQKPVLEGLPPPRPPHLHIGWVALDGVSGFEVVPEGEMGFQKHHSHVPDLPTDIYMCLWICDYGCCSHVIFILPRAVLSWI